MTDKRGIKQREILIIILLSIGVITFLIQQFYVQAQDRNKKKYLNEQKEVTTSDLDYIKDYKKQYMGNASNTINLFYSMPLSAAIKDFKFYSDKLTVQVNFKDTMLNAGKISMENKSFAAEGTVDKINAVYQNEVEKSLIYNSVAAFALIDNLEGIIFNFTDINYTVSRDDIESEYGKLDTLLEKNTWNKKVRDPLGNVTLVSELAGKLLKN